ncbi:WLM-domain-containing protein [Russula aff. rugulosa BPL654]|nr:WLM-domain-containing protein [Russula aff. rugulosa BPL654]
MSIDILHRGIGYNLSLLPDDTLAILASHTPATLIKDAGLTPGLKVTMLGSMDQELSSMMKMENEQRRREQIMQDRASKGTIKVRSVGTATKPNSFIFHKLEPFAHLPNSSSALNLLRRLSSDPAIGHVMVIHQFSVGLLTELAPHEPPELLGRNMNIGQAIELRLRTDRYDGFRSYRDIRRVLCHELAHNVWSDHSNNFKELESKLNREVLEFERRVRDATHTVGGDNDVYEPPSTEPELEAQVHVLGGSGRAPASDESVEERRRRLLQAIMNRVKEEEEEIENSCGTGPASRAQ